MARSHLGQILRSRPRTRATNPLGRPQATHHSFIPPGVGRAGLFPIADPRLSTLHRQQLVHRAGQTVGNRAVQRLLADAQRESEGGTPVLRQGARSPAVAKLQTSLRSAGADISADGIFGPKTRQAVVGFQKAAGLAPDGIVGPKTWAKLEGGAVQIPQGATKPGQGPGPGSGAQAALIKAKLAQIKALVMGLKARQPGASTSTESKAATAVPAHDHAVPGRDDGGEEESWLDSATSWAEEQAGAAAEWAGETAGDVAEWAGETAGEAVDWVSEQASSAADWAAEQASSAADWAGETAGAAAEWVEEKAEQVWEGVSETASEVVEEIESIAGDVAEWLDGPLSKLGELIDKAFSPDSSPLEILDEILKELEGKPDGAKEPPVTGNLEPITTEPPARAMACDLPPAGRPLKVRLKLALEPAIGEGPTSGENSRTDPVSSSGLWLSSTVQRGNVSQLKGFGREEPHYKLDLIYWKAENDVLEIGGRMRIDCLFQTADQSRQDISGPEDPKITKDNWAEVHQDLLPVGRDFPAQPTRAKYWSAALSEKHERFHAQDDIGEAGKQLEEEKKKLDKLTTRIPWWITESDEVAINNWVKFKLQPVPGNVQNGVEFHYQQGGEVRAYKDGEADYKNLAEGVKARAKREKWPGAG